MDSRNADVDRLGANSDQRQLDGPTDFDSADHVRNIPVDGRPEPRGEHGDGTILELGIDDPNLAYPSADDPFVSQNDPEDEAEPVGDEPAGASDPTGAQGPSYEQNQGPEDHGDGGSSDPNNSLMPSSPNS